MKARLLALAVLVLGIASCQKDADIVNPVGNGEVDFQLVVGAEELATRAGLDGASDNQKTKNSAYGAIDYLQATDWSSVDLRYTLEVYDWQDLANGGSYEGKTPVKDRQVIIVPEYKSVVFDLRLVPERQYHFVVFADFVPEGEAAKTVDASTTAQAELGKHHTIGETLADITIKGDAINDECTDAYFATKDITITNSAAQDIVLKRPYGKIRVVATDLHELNINVDPKSVKVVYTSKHPQTFNAVTGAVGAVTENVDYTFNSTYNMGVGKQDLQKHFYTDGYDSFGANDEYKYTAANGDVRHTHMTLFTDYVLATPEGHTPYHFTMTVYDNNGKPIRETYFSTDIPVERNHLTTVIGNVLTTATNIEVRIDDNFAEENIDIKVYSGYYTETLVLGSGQYIFRDLNVTTTSGHAVEIEENANVAIDVVGDVVLNGAKGGIYVPDNSTLTIKGVSATRSNAQNGSLNVVGNDGSGIGGKSIAISDIAKLTAKGNGKHGFGIGRDNATVTITNTTIDYVCGGHISTTFASNDKYGKNALEGGAAIGGAKVTLENVTITKAEGGSKAAAIGNKFWTGTEVTIKGSTLGDIFGGNASAAIGGSRYNENSKHNIKIAIEDSTIKNAVGGQAGAGIGSGYDVHCNQQSHSATNEIVIKNSNITATGGKYAAGIGTGFHSAYLTGSIDGASTINALSGEKVYKAEYTHAQNIGYGVVDPAREFSGENANVTFTVGGKVIPTPATYDNTLTVNTIEELQAAIDGATIGDNIIYFGADITGNATVVQAEGIKIIIDGCGKGLNGEITVNGKSKAYATAALTVKNVNFTLATNGVAIHLGTSSNTNDTRYATNVTIDGCSFTGEGKTAAVVKSYTGGDKNLTITNNSATGLHSFTQLKNVEGVKISDCTINDCKNGISLGCSQNVTIDNTSMDCIGYGVRADGTNKNTVDVVMNGCVVNAYIPVTVRYMNNDNCDLSFSFDGENKFTRGGKYDVVVCSNEYGEGVKPEAPKGTIDLRGSENMKVYIGKIYAKVGNTEYDDFDDALANWTNNTTLTLLADVTLSDVVKIKSTEYHILDLGTYTLTAAKGKNAIEITTEGRSNQSYALDIKADATNPGGITATSKAIVKTTGKSGVKDRPIIRFYNGIFNANNIIQHSGSNGTNSPQFNFYDGVYNGGISTNRAICIFEGGTFNGRFYMSVDSSSYARIGGGKFKYMDNLYGSSLNSSKFTIGSAKDVFDRGVYVDNDGYIVVDGPVITEFGDKFKAKAKASSVSMAGTYLPYSSAATYGLYYTNAEMAITKHGEANVELP